jgi:hypothetical protein
MGEMSRWLHAALMGLLLAEIVVVGTTMSATCDETGHFGAGLYIWDRGQFDVYRVNPPFVRAVSGAAVALLNPKRDYSHYDEGPAVRVEWRLGQDLIAANPDEWNWYFLMARWAVIPFGLLGAWYIRKWAGELWDARDAPHPSHSVKSQALSWCVMGPCGLTALAVYCFCPNIVAWSGTITPDAAAAVLGLASTYSFWKWLRIPTWRATFIAGVWLGFAELTKFSWIILFPLWILLWAFWRLNMCRGENLRQPECGNQGGNADQNCPAIQPLTARDLCDSDAAACVNDRPPLNQLSVILIIAIDIINLGYFCEGSLTPLREFVFVSRTLAGPDSKVDGGTGGNRFRGSWIGQIPIPLPYNYVRGIDLQKVDFEEGKPSYLNGQWSPRGWWYYYLYAAVLKVPLGTWLVGLTVLLMKLSGFRRNRHAEAEQTSAVVPSYSRTTWRDEVVLLAPAVVLFVVVSSQTGFSRYFRYVLPCFPFIYVWLGQSGRWLSDLFAKHSAGGPQLGLFQRWAGLAVAGGLSWSIISAVSVFPHSMSYFNELAGGPRNGHYYLIDANIDWGQDMWFLRNWVRKHPEAQPLHVAPLCFVHPKYYGIESLTPPEVPRPGWFAMSIHRIHGESGKYNFFLRYKPVALAGYSIYIYHVTLEDANRVRRELGYPELSPDAGIEPHRTTTAAEANQRNPAAACCISGA